MSKNGIRKNCTNCIYFDIETFYGVCNKHGVILNDEKPVSIKNIKEDECEFEVKE